MQVDLITLPGPTGLGETCRIFAFVGGSEIRRRLRKRTMVVEIAAVGTAAYEGAMCNPIACG